MNDITIRKLLQFSVKYPFTFSICLLAIISSMSIFIFTSGSWFVNMFMFFVILVIIYVLTLVVLLNGDNVIQKWMTEQYKNIFDKKIEKGIDRSSDFLKDPTKFHSSKISSVYKWEVLRNGKLWSNGIDSEEECIKHIEETLLTNYAKYSYRPIIEVLVYGKKTDYIKK